jgi:hypothetical protein
MGGYTNYLRNDKCHASKFFNETEMKEHFNRLIIFNKYLNEAKYWGRDLLNITNELEENEGYRYCKETNTIKHLMTQEMLDVLEAIKTGNLPILKYLNDKGHKVGCYKAVNIRLAILHGHIDIILYLIHTHQINRDISQIIGQLSTPTDFEKLYNCSLLRGEKKEYLPEHDNDIIKYLDKLMNCDVSIYFKNCSCIDIGTVYKVGKEANNINLVKHIENNYFKDNI